MGKKAQRKRTGYSVDQRVTRSKARKRDAFPFLDLPAELRLQIYEYALPEPKEYPEGWRNSCIGSCVHCLYEQKPRKPAIAFGFVALMSTNRLIYQETCDVLYGNPPHGRPPMVQMDVGDYFIRIRDYNFYCKHHHVFDKSFEGVFARFRHIELHVHAFCDPFPDDISDVSYADPDEEILLVREKCLRDNLHWVASKLRLAKSLSSMVVEQADFEFYEFNVCVQKSCANRKLEYIFSPLKAVTSLDRVDFKANVSPDRSDGVVDHVKTGGYCSGCRFDVTVKSGAWEAKFLRRLRTRMTSKEPIEDESELFSLFHDFVNKLKKCERSGTRIDTRGLFQKAQYFRERGQAQSFNSIVDQFAIELKKEISQKLALYNEVESLEGRAIKTGEVEEKASAEYASPNSQLQDNKANATLFSASSASSSSWETETD